MITLSATKRSKTDKIGDLRTNGMTPSVVYGAKVENTPISVSASEFVKVFKQVGESSTLVLDIEGKKVDVLVHDVQFDPIKSKPVHVDFLAIDMNKVVEVSVPLEFVGIAPAEKNNLGTLVKVLHEVEISALPKDLPHNIEVDLSVLETLENQIHVRDIVLPAGVEMITDGDEVIALVAQQKEEVEETAPIDLSAIEVEHKGKKDEEGTTEEEKA